MNRVNIRPVVCATLVAVLLAPLLGFAASDFDDTLIPRAQSVMLKGGCGTVIAYRNATDVEPRFSNENWRSGFDWRNMAGLAGFVPGFAGLAAVGVGVLAIGTVQENSAAVGGASNSIDGLKWKNVYLAKIKPDVGPEFEIPYEDLSGKPLLIGNRVLMVGSARYLDSYTGFNLVNIGKEQVGKPGDQDYYSVCYENQKYGPRQLVSNGNGFDWKRVGPQIQISADIKAAEDAKKKADAAEAASYDHR